MIKIKKMTAGLFSWMTKMIMHDKELKKVEIEKEEKDIDDLLKSTFSEAERAALEGDREKAIELFDGLIESASTSKLSSNEKRILIHLCCMHLGNIYLGDEETKTALTYFKKAEKAEIDINEARKGIAMCYFRSGQYEKSITIYTMLENNENTRFFALFGKGVSLKAMGKYKEAREWLLQAEELEPNNQAVLYNLSHIEYLNENNEMALELINRALDIDPEDSDTLYGKAMVLLMMHKYSNAVEIFNKVIEKKPDFAELYCRKADALRHLGRLDEAVYYYNLALMKNISLSEAYYGKGVVLAQKGQLKEALNIMDETISINNTYADAYIGRSMIQMYFNEIEEGHYTDLNSNKLN